MLLTVSKRLEFSASRRLQVKHWSDRENLAAFGPETVADHGTGRNYVAYFIFTGPVNTSNGMLINISEIKERAGKLLRARFDHKFLNQDNPSFSGVPVTVENIARQLHVDLAPLFSDFSAKLVACHVAESPERSATFYSDGAGEEVKGRSLTTESLAGYIYEQANASMPLLHRLRLYERDDFFAEAWNDATVFLGVRMPFNAAHRLHAACFSDAENTKLYGKCNNPLGHGHRYVTETTIGGEYDKRTGTVQDFDTFRKAIAESLAPWQDRHLDLETDEFRDTPSTGENIVRSLWPKIDNRLDQKLVRLRLWETANNRFTLRRT